MQKVILFGLGRQLQKMSAFINADLNHIVAFADNNEKRGGRVILGIPVICPSEISKFNYDKIVITSKIYFEEIYHQLVHTLGVSPDAIMPIDDYYKPHINFCTLSSELIRVGYEDLQRQILKAGQLSKESLKNCRLLENRK